MDHFYFFKLYLLNIKQYMSGQRTIQEFCQHYKSLYDYSSQFINVVDNGILLYFSFVYFIYHDKVFGLWNSICKIFYYIYVTVIIGFCMLIILLFNLKKFKILIF